MSAADKPRLGLPADRREAYIPLKPRPLPRSTVILDEMRRSWAKSDALQAEKRRKHAHKAARAGMRRAIP